jgi:multidrug resistance efflux pump
MKALSILPIACLFLAPGCQRPAVVKAGGSLTAVPADQGRPAQEPRETRATGSVQAIRASNVQVPQILDRGGNLTLVKLALNGSLVNQGDTLAEFDRTAQVDAAREAKAKFEDLVHQVRQKVAQNRSDAEKRALDLKQAEAELAKARIQLRIAPVIGEIKRLQNEAKAEGAVARVASLKEIDRARATADAAALRILELQTERQKVALDRAYLNMEKLVLRAAMAGMVALENVWRQGSMGHPQEGDRLWPGQLLLRIFDPGEMEVHVQIAEPDIAVLRPGATAVVYLDAYPGAAFRARFHSASPVATSAIGSPIKNFIARFRLEQSDPRLLPDLSAAVVLRIEGAQP